MKKPIGKWIPLDQEKGGGGGGVRALRHMDGDKALGPEVFNMAFFKHY